MTIVPLILQIIALACLFCAAFNIPTARVNWLGLGLFLWLLSLMVSGLTLHATAGVH